MHPLKLFGAGCVCFVVPLRFSSSVLYQMRSRIRVRVYVCSNAAGSSVFFSRLFFAARVLVFLLDLFASCVVFFPCRYVFLQFWFFSFTPCCIFRSQCDRTIAFFPFLPYPSFTYLLFFFLFCSCFVLCLLYYVYFICRLLLCPFALCSVSRLHSMVFRFYLAVIFVLRSFDVVVVGPKDSTVRSERTARILSNFNGFGFSLHFCFCYTYFCAFYIIIPFCGWLLAIFRFVRLFVALSARLDFNINFSRVVD